jgi:hypothetical protein
VKVWRLLTASVDVTGARVTSISLPEIITGMETDLDGSARGVAVTRIVFGDGETEGAV